MNNIMHTPDYYKKVFDNLSRMLRVLHRDLNFGYLTVSIARSSFTIRWTVRRKSYKKFVYEIPISFESLLPLEPSELFPMAEDIVKVAISQLPKELIRNPNE